MVDQEQAELELKELKEMSNSLRDKLMPYQRPILYIGISLLLLLLLFIGFSIGAYSICRQADGFLDDKFYCHVDYYNEQKRQQDKIFNDFDVPDLRVL